MRKLLLGTTAIAAAATLTANAALADVSISGAYEFFYQSRSSNITANDGTSTDTDSEIAIKFSNKTDSGLTIGFVTELTTDEADSGNDESSISISGGFGKIVLGENDGVGDNYGVASTDLIAEEVFASGTGALTNPKPDIAGLGADNPKIAYHLPAMGGLTAGISHTNSGAAGATDTTQYGLQYAMSAGGAGITIGAATGTTEAATKDTDSQQMGIKVTSGNITAAVSQSTYEGNGFDEDSTGAAISFKVSDAMTVGLHTTEANDDTNNQEYTNSGAEIQYTIASGLTAVVGVEDYDYKVGTSSGTVADSGTVSRLTIKASF